MLPNFIIIGAQKSASTFLQACLNDHPNIYLPTGETPFFESPDYEMSDIRELAREFQAKHEKRLGIKRPNYIGKPEVPERIVTHLPNAKLLAVLRDPIDRAISAYYHNIKNGFLPVMDIETGMRKLLSEPAFAKKYERSAEIIEFGYYYKYLSKYSHYKQRNQLLTILYEDIVSEPLKTIQKAYRFLEVSHTHIPKTLNLRPQEVVYNLVRLKLLCFRNRFTFAYNQDRTRSFLREMTFTDKLIVRTLTTIDQSLLSKVLTNQTPNLSPSLRKTLCNTYASDIQALESFIDRDLSAWRQY